MFNGKFYIACGIILFDFYSYIGLASMPANNIQDKLSFELFAIVQKFFSTAETTEEKEIVLEPFLSAYYYGLDRIAITNNQPYSDQSIIAVTYDSILGEFYICAKILKTLLQQKKQAEIQVIMSTVWQHNLSRLNAYPVACRPMLEEQCALIQICRNLFCIDPIRANQVIQARCNLLPEEFRLPLQIFLNEAGFIKSPHDKKLRKHLEDNKLAILSRKILTVTIGREFQIAHLYLEQKDIENLNGAPISINEFSKKYFCHHD